MNRYFADTFFYLALLNERDEAHQRVLKLNSELDGGIVTTHWVLIEVGDALSDPASRMLFLELLRMLESNPDVTIIEAGPELFDKAVALFEARSDKSWSLTDCTSFVVMEELQVLEALTGDHHFEQAGFHALLRSRD
jgi:predicted nucleic acid-binding protein